MLGTTPTSTHADAPAHVFINFAPQEYQQHRHTFVVFIDLTPTTDHIDTSSPSSSTSAPTPKSYYIGHHL
jgi:hypothetical protein